MANEKKQYEILHEFKIRDNSTGNTICISQGDWNLVQILHCDKQLVGDELILTRKEAYLLVQVLDKYLSETNHHD